MIIRTLSVFERNALLNFYPAPASGAKAGLR